MRLQRLIQYQQLQAYISLCETTRCQKMHVPLCVSLIVSFSVWSSIQNLTTLFSAKDRPLPCFSSTHRKAIAEERDANPLWASKLTPTRNFHRWVQSHASFVSIIKIPGTFYRRLSLSAKKWCRAHTCAFEDGKQIKLFGGMRCKKIKKREEDGQQSERVSATSEPMVSP